MTPPGVKAADCPVPPKALGRMELTLQLPPAMVGTPVELTVLIPVPPTAVPTMDPLQAPVVTCPSSLMTNLAMPVLSSNCATSVPEVPRSRNPDTLRRRNPFMSMSPALESWTILALMIRKSEIPGVGPVAEVEESMARSKEVPSALSARRITAEEGSWRDAAVCGINVPRSANPTEREILIRSVPLRDVRRFIQTSATGSILVYAGGDGGY
jgi:hypothetical protein